MCNFLYCNYIASINTNNLPFFSSVKSSMEDDDQSSTCDNFDIMTEGASMLILTYAYIQGVP